MIADGWQRPPGYDAQGAEAESESGSQGRVLRNLIGIRAVRDMARAESDALLRATDRLFEQFTEDHRFRSEDINAIHREWLGGIYAWAGSYRSVNISKDGFQFAAADQIPRLMLELERGALSRCTPCRPQPADMIARAIAEVHAELVLIHPYREGNGRCARILASLMAVQAGLPPLDFGGIAGATKRAYIGAIHAALARDYGPMTGIFRSVIARTLRVYRSP